MHSGWVHPALGKVHDVWEEDGPEASLPQPGTCEHAVRRHSLQVVSWAIQGGLRGPLSP